MKLGEVSDSINSVSLRCAIGNQTYGNINKDSKIIHTFVDKTTEVLDFGSRKQKIVTVEFLDIDNDDFVTLINFLDDKQGEAIKVEEELSGETIFSETNPYTTYYCKVLNYSADGEQAYSTTRKRFKCSVDLAYLGQNSTDKINEDDTSLIDVLIEIDTKRADYEQSAEPSGEEGERWFDTDDNKMYIHDGSTWNFIYTVSADNSTYGFIDGVFYWSLFSSISQNLGASPDAIPQDYISGFVNRGSFKFPNKSIDISNGPNIEYRNGFSFDIKNETPFWNFISQNGIILFGAKVTIKTYQKIGSSIKINKYSTGFNNTNEFGYSDYTVFAEPRLYNFKSKFNETKTEIGVRFPTLKESAIGKPYYRTYGLWEYAALQDVGGLNDRYSFNVYQPGQANYFSDFKIAAYIDRTYASEGVSKHLFIYKNNHPSGSDKYRADLTGNTLDNGNWAISVLYDTKTDSGNKDKVVSIVDITENATYYDIELSRGLEIPNADGGAPNPPGTSDYLIITFLNSVYRYQWDDRLSGGVKIYDKENGTYTQGLNLLGLNSEGTEIISIPSSGAYTSQSVNQYGIIAVSPENTTNEEKSNNFRDVTNGDYEISAYPKITGKMLEIPGSTIDFVGPIEDYTYNSSYSKNSTIIAGPASWNRNIWVVSQNAQMKKSSDFLTSGAIFLDNRDQNSGKGVFAFQLNIDHTTDTESFLLSNEVRLCVNFDIRSCLKINHNELDNEIVLPNGFKMHMRLKKYDGTYINNDDWTNSFSREQLGLSKETIFKGWGALKVNNIPSIGNFEDKTVLGDNIDYYTTGLGYDITSFAIRNASFDYRNAVKGTRVFVSAEPNLPSGPVSAYISEADFNGDVISFTDDITSGSGLTNGSIISINENAYVLNAGTPQTLVEAVDGVDYSSLVNYGGKDLFDISQMFGENYTWDQVEAVEFIFENEDTSNSQYVLDEDARYGKNAVLDWHFLLQMSSGLNSVKLFSVSEESLTGRPLFHSIAGVDLDSDGNPDFAINDFPTHPARIVKSILNECYPNRWNESSADTLETARPGWFFRKQFYDTLDSSKVLEEILLALWSSAYFDNDDKLTLKSLRPEDNGSGSPSLAFSDSNIIDGSFSIVKMRNSDEIFQKFSLNYDYYPPGKFSSALNEYNKNILIDKDYNSQNQTFLKWSSYMYENENVLEKDIEYHYQEESATQLANYMAEWFVFNSWEIEFDLSLSDCIGFNEIKILDYASFTSNFFTNNELVEGFVTSVNPDIYEGVVKIRMWVHRPPGVFGPWNDPFNDALHLSTRDISGWSDANGRINDSGRVSTRTLGSFTIKDAGRVSTRDFND